MHNWTADGWGGEGYVWLASGYPLRAAFWTADGWIGNFRPGYVIRSRRGNSSDLPFKARL